MKIQIVKFQKIQDSKTLKGFLTIRLPALGLEIRSIALHAKGNERSLQWPARPYKRPDGRMGWSYFLHFYDKKRYQQFQSVVLQALDNFQRQDKGNINDTKIQSKLF